MTQRWGDTLYQPTQWYPRVAVYDGLRGWDPELYLGPSEFYNNFGRFDVRIEGRHPLFPVIGRLINMRSRLTGIATGDQAIFARRDAFHAAGGFAAIPVMEDIALSKHLKRVGRPLCLRECVITSGRRWEKHGVLRTIMLMWRLRLAYFFGADARQLARQYGYD